MIIGILVGSVFILVLVVKKLMRPRLRLEPGPTKVRTGLFRSRYVTVNRAVRRGELITDADILDLENPYRVEDDQ